MYCDRCGAALSPGAQYCTACGKAVSGAAPAAPSPTPPPAVSKVQWLAQTRVQRHLNVLASLWLIMGILRVAGAIWILIFGQFFLPFLGSLAGAGGWPGGRNFPFDLVAMGLYASAIFLGVFGALHVVLAWGLFQRQSWARVLGLILGFISLIRIPFGTALGVYTLWVLLPEHSGQEWGRLCQAYQQRSQVSA